MEHSSGLYNKEHLEKLSQDPKNRVLIPTHDIEFKPWPAMKVRECIDKILNISYTSDDSRTIRSKCMMDNELVEFASKHNSMYDKLTDPKYFRDDRFLNGIMTLVELRSQVEKGELAEGDDATKKAVTAMLQMTMEPESRIEDVTDESPRA